MSGRTLLLVVFYVLLYVLVLRWAFQKPTHPFPDDEKYIRATLKKLLIARHVGSPGHAAVRDFLDKELMRLGFLSKSYDFFEGINYSNVVGYWNDQADQYLVLTSHYDGPSPRKEQEKDVLVSATDGAVSCAILLALARTFRLFARSLGPSTGLLVFFDGHESQATEPEKKPKLYGSQHFVNSQIIPKDEIALVVSLNHIGAPNQTFPSFSEKNHKNHNRIANIERELRKSGKLVDSHVLFHKIVSYKNDLPDDHVPFKEYGVPVLHIAPPKYPDVHHTAADKAENLHWPTILNMIKILRHFIFDFLVSIDTDEYESDFYGYINGEYV
nr:glutaminyl-peptide cyclotransferase isoform X2 [Drosophila kikkawai]